MHQDLHEQVDHRDGHRDRDVAAQHPHRAERPDRHRGGHGARDQHVQPFRTAVEQRLRALRDHDQLERAPADQLQHVQRGGQVGQSAAEQSAQHHHRRRPGARAGNRGQADHDAAQHGADDRGHDRGDDGQLRRVRRLQHRERAGETEQADPEIGPQRALVGEAEHLRRRPGQGRRHLCGCGRGVTRCRGRAHRPTPYAGITRSGSSGRRRVLPSSQPGRPSSRVVDVYAPTVGVRRVAWQRPPRGSRAAVLLGPVARLDGLHP